MQEQPDNVSPRDKRSVAALVCLAGCLVYGLAFLSFPPALQFLLPSGHELVLWRDLLVHKLRWVLIGLGVALSATGFALSRTDPHRSRMLRILAPVEVFPWLGIILLLGDILPLGIVSNAIIYVPALIVALVVLRLAETGRNEPAGTGKTLKEYARAIFLVSVVCYTCLGCCLAYLTGEHVGDEGHYLIQTESLYLDHDLDIKNNFLKQDKTYGRDFDVEKRILEQTSEKELNAMHRLFLHTHISARSLGKHWYSIHPYGLPLILAPFWGLGMVMRYIILAIIAALGNLAIYKVARAFGAGRTAALAAVLAFATSIYWAVYSSRVLPEVLGATLLGWVFWAILFQEQRPWLTTIVAGICCGYIPMAHERFIVPSLMGFGFYGLFGLFSGGKWARKIPRLAAFTLLTFAGYGILAVSQFLMFEKGMKFGVGGGLFSYWPGMWGAIADWRGVVPVLPLFMWLVPALIVAAFLPSMPLRNRFYVLAVGITFVVSLAASCANGIYTGGKCLPGRYVLVVVPLLVPVAALIFEKTTPIARFWFLFLGATSAALLVMTLVLLPILGRNFIFPITSAADLHPALRALLNPHAFFLCPPEWLIGHTAATVYVAAGMLLTIPVLLLPQRLKVVSALLIASVCALAAWSHTAQSHPVAVQTGEDALFPKYLCRISRDRVCIPTPLCVATNLFDVSRLTFRDYATATSNVGVTTADLGARTAGRMVSQPRLEVNDWANRGYAWTTFTAPFKPVPGRQMLHMKGTVEGNTVPILALRQGSRMIMEDAVPVDDGLFEQNYVFHCSRFAGNMYILVRLDGGEGTFTLKEFYWTPYSDRLVKDTNIILPGNVTVVAK